MHIISHLLNHKPSTENNGRLIEVVMFIAVDIVISPCHSQTYPSSSLPFYACDEIRRSAGNKRGEGAREKGITQVTYLNVPTPPASRINDVSIKGFPVHRIANARRICPCATTRTSPFPASEPLSRQGRWYFSLISAIRASRRLTTSSGDLFVRFALAGHLILGHLLSQQHNITR